MENIKRELFDRLKEFHSDKDFVVGVLSNAPNEDDMRTILAYMEHGRNVTTESIILLSLELGNNRK